MSSIIVSERVNARRSAPPRGAERGFTLVELIVCVVILSVLALMALPIARYTVKREKERELRASLQEIRDAIDRFKDASDRGYMQVKIETFGYPPTLDDLTKTVEIQGHKVKFLPHIPKDPMTNSYDWGMRSMQDDYDSDSWGGQNVWNVYTKSDGTALNGTKYKDW